MCLLDRIEQQERIEQMINRRRLKARQAQDRTKEFSIYQMESKNKTRNFLGLTTTDFLPFLYLLNAELSLTILNVFVSLNKYQELGWESDIALNKLPVCATTDSCQVTLVLASPCVLVCLFLCLFFSFSDTNPGSQSCRTSLVRFRVGHKACKLQENEGTFERFSRATLEQRAIE